MHMRRSGPQQANRLLQITTQRHLSTLARVSVMRRDRLLLYKSVGGGLVNAKNGMCCARWQHATTAASSVSSDPRNVQLKIQAMLMEVLGILRNGPDREHWQKDIVKEALERYAKTIHLISEYDMSAHRNQLQTSCEDIEMSGVVGNLIQVSYRLAVVVCCYAVQCIQAGQLSAAINALVMATKIDCAYDPGHLLSATVLSRIQRYMLGKKELEAVSIAILRIVTVRGLPERFMSAMAGALYRRKSYDMIEMCEGRITHSNISASIARVLLLSIRKQQLLQTRQRPDKKTKRPPHKDLQVLNRCKFLETVSTCGFCRRARNIVDMLWKSDRKSVTEAHLTKLLEIELSSIGRSVMLPRELDLWLRNFVHYDIRPSVKTFTVVTNAYFLHGDHQFAWSIFESMKHGSMQSLSGMDGRIIDLELPQPNDVTFSMVTAHAWTECKQNTVAIPFENILGSIEMRGKLQNRLVTSAVSVLVNSSRLGDAEQTWIRYGCHCAVSESRRQSTNIWALTKLALGYAQAGEVEKAAAFLHEACRYRFTKNLQSRVDGDSGTLYLSVVFNAVLCSAIRSDSQSKLGRDVAMRRDLYLLRLACEYHIPLDTTTYNVLLAALSQLVRQGTGNRGELADSMQELYYRMVGQGVTLDDTTIAHLIPLWVHLGRRDMATSYWRQCSRHRPPRKIGQLRRHVVAMARRWNVVDKTLDIINQ
ncbi:hypothetical protein COEREDRAFT_82398 [Coemansia reversa NRRL 1564]|uniref:Uncharacterized protein n=1 Tax=Coemansia reversa (strain ATCC 12441 / NRRL 1564) TaxID=763665 RepID=A0A2G5B7M1_COERN|nr:hypothetical protein COEREDRAFT_82398 [Coemansia reversa NRRL 1564]|eukprot:PIA14984.1 hypothetical protein COEREDRAFT_82398 [Coemansia reversa NRRL 1564]